MVTFSANVIRRVADAMEAARETPFSLSEKTGIPRTTLRRCLEGHRVFNTDELDRIAAALGVDIADLVQRKGSAA